MLEEKKYQIKHKWTGEILSQTKDVSLRVVVEKAVKKGADLGGADLNAYLAIFTEVKFNSRIHVCPRLSRWRQSDVEPRTFPVLR